MQNGPIPLAVHAAIESVAGGVLVAAPWLFAFTEIEAATVISIVLGLATLAVGVTTRLHPAPLRQLPLPAHFAADLIIAALLILSPIVLDYGMEDAATRFMIVAGIVLMLVALATRWEPVERARPRGADRPGG